MPGPVKDPFNLFPRVPTSVVAQKDPVHAVIAKMLALPPEREPTDCYAAVAKGDSTITCAHTPRLLRMLQPTPALPKPVKPRAMLFTSGMSSNKELELKRLATLPPNDVLDVGDEQLEAFDALDPDEVASTLGLTGEQSSHFQLALQMPDTGRAAKHLAIRFAEAERGSREIKKLTLSGHSLGNGILGVPQTFVAQLARTFPKAAAQIEQVMVSGCHAGYEFEVGAWRAAFPNLKTFVGYDRKAPSGEVAAADIVAFARDRDPKNTARWTSAAGYRGTTSKMSKAQLSEFIEHGWQWVYLRYQANPELRVRSGPRDPELAYYYLLLQQLANHRDTTPSERIELRERIQRVLSWRHPELVAPRD